MASHAVQWAVEEVIVPFLKFRKRSDASAAYAMVGMRALGLMLDPSTDFTSADARMQRDVPTLLAPAIEQMLLAAYSQCGLQRVGIRYYPLSVDAPDGSQPECFAATHASFVTDFGPHPLGERRRNADVGTVLRMVSAVPYVSEEVKALAAAARRLMERYPLADNALMGLSQQQPEEAEAEAEEAV